MKYPQSPRGPLLDSGSIGRAATGCQRLLSTTSDGRCVGLDVLSGCTSPRGPYSLGASDRESTRKTLKQPPPLQQSASDIQQLQKLPSCHRASQPSLVSLRRSRGMSTPAGRRRAVQRPVEPEVTVSHRFVCHPAPLTTTPIRRLPPHSRPSNRRRTAAVSSTCLEKPTCHRTWPAPPNSPQLKSLLL